MLKLITIGTAALLLLASACGGGGDSKTIDTGDGEVTIGGDLPGDFPDDFPVYEDADLQGAVQGEQGGVEGIVATWTSGDSFDDVKAFYADAFDDGPWTTTAEGTAGPSTYWGVENSATGKVGYVAVSDGDEVSIIAVVGDNPDQAGSDASSNDGDDEEDAASDDSSTDEGSESSLPDAVDLPAGYPSDLVPIPDGAVVSLANTVSAGGVETFQVTFYSKESVDDLAAFYKEALEGKGYTQSIQTSSADGVYAAYSENEDGSGTIVVLTFSSSDVDGYQQGYLQVSSG